MALRFENAVRQVRSLVAFAHLRLFEADMLAAEMVKETDTFAQQHRHHIHMNFNQKTSNQELLLDMGAVGRTSCSA
ncbi:MAG: hypothetical protein ACXVCX_03775 [Ktedonobacterales bacterium]